jgi:uridylate kinase
MARSLRYKRVLLKLSGEAMCSPGGFAVQASAVEQIVAEVRQVVEMGAEVGLVIGGGNFIRGRDLTYNPHIRRTTADFMGMLATIMNSLALRDAFETRGIKAAVLSPIADPRLCEPYACRRAVELLEGGSVVVLAGGTGSPYFTTDTCAALRACELSAEVLLKATTVDGVYDSDPKRNPQARRYERLTYAKALADKLGVMDLTAISLCMESRVPIMVFALAKPGSLADAVCGENVGTIIAE